MLYWLVGLTPSTTLRKESRSGAPSSTVVSSASRSSTSDLTSLAARVRWRDLTRFPRNRTGLSARETALPLRRAPSSAPPATQRESGGRVDEAGVGGAVDLVDQRFPEVEFVDVELLQPVGYRTDRYETAPSAPIPATGRRSHYHRHDQKPAVLPDRSVHGSIHANHDSDFSLLPMLSSKKKPFAVAIIFEFACFFGKVTGLVKIRLLPLRFSLI